MDKVTHFEIPVEDIEKSKSFYEKVFGWEIKEIEGMNYYIVRTGSVDENGKGNEMNAISGGMFAKGDFANLPVVVFATVDSIDDRVAKIKELGGSVLKEKFAVGDFGFVAYVKDPEGNAMGMWEDVKK